MKRRNFLKSLVAVPAASLISKQNTDVLKAKEPEPVKPIAPLNQLNKTIRFTSYATAIAPSISDTRGPVMGCACSLCNRVRAKGY